MKIIALVFLILVAGCQSTPSKEHLNVFSSEKHISYKEWNRTPECCTAKGSQAAVASGGTHSSKAGVEILKKGGNAVDAAVATAFGIAVERPHSAGIGGGGFMTLHLNQKTPVDIFVDFRETAPQKAHRDMYLDKAGNVIPNLSLKGPLSIATPSFVAGLYAVHKKYGKLKWKDVVEPAALIAERGFLVYPSLQKAIERANDSLLEDAFLRSLLFKNGHPLQVGDRLVQKDLAKTIRTLGTQGEKFFKGALPKKIASFVQSKGGILDAKDFSKYEVKFREPIRGKFKNTSFISAPPPSAGGVLISEAFNTLSGYDLGEISKNPGEYIHLVTEVLKRVYADRFQYLGDSDFVKLDYANLLTEENAASLRKSIHLHKATPSLEIKNPKVQAGSGTHTSHLSVVDAEGNAVATTITINTSFGSGMAVPGTGIILNNEMDDFSSKVGVANAYGLVSSEANGIEPGKRPVSSMTPTIFFRDGKPVLVVGGAGGSRIITGVLETSLNYLQLFPNDVRRSVFAPRFHHQWLPDELSLEGDLTVLTDELKSKGQILSSRSYSPVIEAVGVNAEGQFTATFDPRDEGGAEAY